MPHYKNMNEFVSDVRLMLNNCTLYNGPENTFTDLAELLRSFFERRLLAEAPLNLIEGLKRKTPTTFYPPVSETFQPQIKKKKVRHSNSNNSTLRGSESLSPKIFYSVTQRSAPPSTKSYSLFKTNNRKVLNNDKESSVETRIISFKKPSEIIIEKTPHIFTSTHSGFIIHQLKVVDIVIMKRQFDSLWNVNGIIQLAACWNDVEFNENIEWYISFGEDEFKGIWLVLSE